MSQFTKIINNLKINNIKPTFLEKINNNQLVIYNRPTNLMVYNKLTKINKPANRITKIVILINRII